MAVQLNAVSLLSVSASITPTAPLIEGLTPVTLVAGVKPRFDTGASAPIGRYGMRVTYPAPLDFSGSDYVSMAHGCQIYSPATQIDTLANGGNRLYFIDGAGNYAGFNTYGGNIPDYDPAGAADGFLGSYSGVMYVYHFAKTRIPDIASGVLNWANITAVEWSIKTTAVTRKDLEVYRPVRRSAPSVTGTETFATLVSACRAAAAAILDPQLASMSQLFLRGSAQVTIGLRLGLTIGNGSTATNFTQSDFALGFENPHEFSPAFRSVGPWSQHGAGHVRALKIQQSAADVLSLTDASIASAGWWQWELSGAGVATCTRVQFWRFDGFRAAHGTYADCQWLSATAPLEVTAATVITAGLIRGATTTALKILSGAGVYAGLALKLDSAAATYDIELGGGGAGTYELLNISVPPGYSLKLRNNSAVNAIGVKIPVGMAYTTSTAGGGITVSVPVVTVNVNAAALVAGSRVQLYNVTDGVEMLNTVLPSAGLTYSGAYAGNKVVRLRADHASKLPLETAGVLTASGLSFLDVQAEDDVYLGNGIDGSSVTEFAPDGANIQVDINDPDGITNIQRLYAWMQWYTTTEAGVRSAFFGAVTAIDSANYLIDQTKADIKLDNVAATPVRVVGGYLYRRDGSTVIAALSHSIQIDPGKAYAVETGVSGLTADESNQLNQISLLALEATAQTAAAQAALAASRAGTLIDTPSITPAEVRDSVWGAPAVSYVTAGTMGDKLNTVDTLALESTAQAAAAGAADLLERPALSAAAITTSLWDALAADHNSDGTLGAKLNSVSMLALETTAQSAASHAALAAALSA